MAINWYIFFRLFYTNLGIYFIFILDFLKYVKAIKMFKNILRINLKTKIDDKEVQWIFIKRADDGLQY